MKKRLKTFGIIASVLLAVGILYYNFGFFERYNFVTAYWDSWTDTNRIVVFGELNQFDVIKAKTARKYGFEYEVAGGCLVTQPLLNGLRDYNAIMAAKINDKLGKDWEDVLEKEISKQIE